MWTTVKGARPNNLTGLLAVAGALLLGCSADPVVLSCLPGAQTACACLGGTSGVQVCGTDRVLGPCQCGGVTDAGPQPDAPSLDTSTSPDVTEPADVPFALDTQPIDVSSLDASAAPDVPVPADVSAPVDAQPLDVPVAPDAPPPPDGSCVPGSATCASTSARSVCGSDGLNRSVVPCAARETCSGSACMPWVCTPGTGTCSDGSTLLACREDGLGQAPVRCGGGPHAPGGNCSGSICQLVCEAWFGNCNGGLVDGCEISLATDVLNCGNCGTVCPTRAHAAPSCATGACGLACNAGFGDCDRVASTGCEVDLASTNAHCGACGMACPVGQNCTAGRCVTPPLAEILVAAPPQVEWVEACTAPYRQVEWPNYITAEWQTSIPFAVRFFGVTIPERRYIYVNVDGWINLTTSGTRAPTGSIPDTRTPNLLIAPYWGDNSNRFGGLCLVTVGTAPNRRWVAEWPDTFAAAAPSSHLTYEVIISEGTSAIDILYQRMDGAVGHTVGVEDLTGTQAITPCGASCAPTAGTHYRFLPAP